MFSSCQKCPCWQAPPLCFQWGRDDWSGSVSDGIRMNQDKDYARNWMFWGEQRSYPDSCAKISKKKFDLWTLVYAAFLENKAWYPLKHITDEERPQIPTPATCKVPAVVSYLTLFSLFSAFRITLLFHFQPTRWHSSPSLSFLLHCFLSML